MIMICEPYFINLTGQRLWRCNLAKMTESELLQQVARALEVADAPDGAMTVIELSDKLQMSGESVRHRLRKLLADGTVHMVRVKRRNMNGVVQHQMLYKMTGKSGEQDEDMSAWAKQSE